MKPYKTALFIFRRDLRLTDNTALQQALNQAERVICAFIVDPVFHRHPHTRRHAKAFLFERLQQLNADLQQHNASLFLLYGVPQGILPGFLRLQGVQAVFVNQEYTPPGVQRDQVLQQLCDEQSIKMHSYHDALLLPPGVVNKQDGSPYTVFTPFYKSACQYPAPSPSPLLMQQAVFVDAADDYRLNAVQLKTIWNIHDLVSDLCQPNVCLEALENCTDYLEQRDFPAKACTTQLSAYLKFGVMSAREAYAAIVNKLGDDSPILRQLYWRDFFTQIAYHFPHVFSGAFRQQYDQIQWQDNPVHFKAWCEGNTGFPLVDAGMRELKTTGYMHNRVRMVVASFLVKDLHLDWRLGERWFAEQLIDYDKAVNNGNWQWAASTGCDAQPYFRIFNPWLQQKKFDTECQYIYRWLPELAHLSPKQIHKGEGLHVLADYPAPLVDHKQQSALAKGLFAECR